MSNLTAISLNTDWWYHFADTFRADQRPTPPENSPWLPLAHLSDWAVTSSGQSGADWFRHDFVLEASDMCVNYKLVISGVPDCVEVFVNGHAIGVIDRDGPMVFDVTNYVALGNNELAMKLTCSYGSQGGMFGDILLQPEPCGC